MTTLFRRMGHAALAGALLFAAAALALGIILRARHLATALLAALLWAAALDAALTVVVPELGGRPLAPAFAAAAALAIEFGVLRGDEPGHGRAPSRAAMPRLT